MTESRGSGGSPSFAALPKDYAAVRRGGRAGPRSPSKGREAAHRPAPESPPPAQGGQRRPPQSTSSSSLHPLSPCRMRNTLHEARNLSSHFAGSAPPKLTP